MDNNTFEVFENNQEGCTLDFDLHLVQKAKGYFVALTDNAVEEINFEAIENLKALAHKMNLKEAFIGYWKDTNTGLHYLDLSVHIEDGNVALKMAKDFNQKAIWDVENCDTIYV
jgi:hypothetical protein